MTARSAVPHDLLHVVDADEVRSTVPAPLPQWAQRSLAENPWVVVRRGRAQLGSVPVGVRGATRAERVAGAVPWMAVAEVIRPEELRSRGSRLIRWPPIAETFSTVHATLDRLGIAWGPTGSVGFTLATGVAVVQDSSDLDVVLRTDRYHGLAGHDLWRMVGESFAGLPCRVDAQLTTNDGTVSLAEYARFPTGPILVRTDSGPVLLADPGTML